MLFFFKFIYLVQHSISGLKILQPVSIKHRRALEISRNVGIVVIVKFTAHLEEL